MPTLARCFVKSALLCFLLALAIGVLQGAQGAFDLPTALVALTPVYFHLFLVGWVAQLIFGLS